MLTQVIGRNERTVCDSKRTLPRLNCACEFISLRSARGEQLSALEHDFLHRHAVLQAESLSASLRSSRRLASNRRDGVRAPARAAKASDRPTMI